MTLFDPRGRPLVPARPEPQVTAKFATSDVGHVQQELRVLAMATGVRLTTEVVEPEGKYDGAPARLECEVYGRERDVERYMDAVKRWSKAGE